MYTWNQINALVKEYLLQFPDEDMRQQNIEGWLERNTANDLFARSNFDGHITTSAFVVDVENREMLLLKHKTLGKWFQPGGHTEADATLVNSALREAIEETGIHIGELEYVPVSQTPDMPVDIDSHYIPANERRQEPGHYHHDFRYLFLYSGARDNAFNTDESTGMKWVSFDELRSDPSFGGVITKVSSLLLPTS
ncbi:MAG: NUDIX hydrolase [Taibaiella sp.]|nr:NUDIX hydrolase [Taibaiella sp.]